MRESLRHKKERSIHIFNALTKKYPNVGTFLTHNSTFQLLIAVILSAQCTDKRVNIVTPSLFHRFPTSTDLAKAPLSEIKEIIRSINFFNTKSKNIKATSTIITNKYKNKVPSSLENLINLPGVGRKTANVVLGQAFNIPGITVDTHVKRVTYRLGLSKETDPVRIEFELMKIWPSHTWNDFSSTLILHGRETCKAQNPSCSNCFLQNYCLKKKPK